MGIALLVTGDKTLRYEQSIVGRNIAVVVLSAQKWTILRDHLEVIGAAMDAARPGSFTLVDCGIFRRVRRSRSSD